MVLLGYATYYRLQLLARRPRIALLEDDQFASIAIATHGSIAANSAPQLQRGISLQRRHERLHC